MIGSHQLSQQGFAMTMTSIFLNTLDPFEFLSVDGLSHDCISQQHRTGCMQLHTFGMVGFGTVKQLISCILFAGYLRWTNIIRLDFNVRRNEWMCSDFQQQFPAACMFTSFRQQRTLLSRCQPTMSSRNLSCSALTIAISWSSFNRAGFIVSHSSAIYRKHSRTTLELRCTELATENACAANVNLWIQ
jgi:hypothetical protein